MSDELEILDDVLNLKSYTIREYIRERAETIVENTLGTVLKYREDQSRVREHGIVAVVQRAFERGALHG